MGDGAVGLLSAALVSTSPAAVTGEETVSVVGVLGFIKAHPITVIAKKQAPI
jgi:hypothetical protein